MLGDEETVVAHRPLRDQFSVDLGDRRRAVTTLFDKAAARTSCRRRTNRSSCHGDLSMVNAPPARSPCLAVSVVTGAAFVPWFHVGVVGLPGVPDPAGYFVAAMGRPGRAVGRGLRTRRDTRQGCAGRARHADDAGGGVAGGQQPSPAGRRRAPGAGPRRQRACRRVPPVGASVDSSVGCSAPRRLRQPDSLVCGAAPSPEPVRTPPLLKPA
jgi:hypothetical protein